MRGSGGEGVCLFLLSNDVEGKYLELKDAKNKASDPQAFHTR